MTRASELFYTRRSRVDRADQDLGLDSFSPERSFYNRRHHNQNYNHRHDLDGCDPLRQSPHARYFSHRSSLSERTPARLDLGTSQNVVNNPFNTEISRSTNRPSLNGNERLPGAVQLARARLLERLRGMSLSGNRGSARASSNIYRGESVFADELRLVDVGDRGSEAFDAWSAISSPFTDLMNSQTQRQQFVHEGKRKKPPGLGQKDLDCLHFEAFKGLEIGGAEGEASKASIDCGICLDPWVRSCGDCPYCRSDVLVLVNSHRNTK